MDNSALAFEGIGALLRRRIRWIVLGVVIGLVAAAVYLVVTPKQYTSTAVVNVTSVSADASDGGRADSALLDIQTERELAGSERTATKAAETLGAGWDADTLMDGVEVYANPDSTVMRVAFTDENEQRAIQGAQEMAAAFLTVRTDLVRERNASKIASLEQEIERVRETYRTRISASPDGSALESSNGEIYLQTLTNLEQRRAALGSIFEDSGSIITPAAANAVYSSPAIRQTLILGALGGLVLGFILAFAAHFATNTTSGRREVSQLLGAPVWPPVAPVGDERRWALATTAARTAAAGHNSVAVIIDDACSDAHSAGHALGKLPNAHVCERSGFAADAIEDAANAGAVIAVIPGNWKKREIEALAESVRSVGADLLGVVLTGSREKLAPLRTKAQS